MLQILIGDWYQLWLRVFPGFGRALLPEDFPLCLVCCWTRKALRCKPKLEAKVVSGRFVWQAKSNAFLQCHHSVVPSLPVSTLPLCLHLVCGSPNTAGYNGCRHVQLFMFCWTLLSSSLQFSMARPRLSQPGLSYCAQSVGCCRPCQIKLVVALLEGQLKGAIQRLSHGTS